MKSTIAALLAGLLLALVVPVSAHADLDSMGLSEKAAADVGAIQIHEVPSTPLITGSDATVTFHITLGESELALDQATRSARLKKRLRFRIDGREIPWRVLSMSPGGEVTSTGAGVAEAVEVTASFNLSAAAAPMKLAFWQEATRIFMIDDRQDADIRDAVSVETLAGVEQQLGYLFFALTTLAAVGAYAFLFWNRLQLRVTKARVVREAHLHELREAAQVSERHFWAGRRPPESMERNPDLTDIPPALRRAFAESTAVLVLGAGLSAHAGLPTAEQTVKALFSTFATDLPASLRRLNAAETILQETGGVDRAMEVILASVPRERVVKEVARLQRGNVDSRLHDVLLAAPWRGVISLSFDNLADAWVRRLPKSAPAWRQVTLLDGPALSECIRTSQPFLLKPYGDVSRPSTMLFSSEELVRHARRSPDFQRSLNLLLQTDCFVFIGLRPTELEDFLTAIAPDAEIREGRHFALLPHDPVNDVLAVTLARFGLTILPYESDRERSTFARFASAMPNSQFAVAADAEPDVGFGFLQSVTLTNIGLFEDLTLDFAASTNPGQGPWTVLFGANGMGKSTILKAISLVLAGDDGAVQTAAQRLLRAGASSGAVELRFGETVLRTELLRDGTTVRARPLQVSPVQASATLVLGFPALRGAPSVNPSGPASIARARPQTSDLTPLLLGEVDRRLGNFKQWLVNVLVEARDGGARSIAMRHLLETLIREMVPGDIDAFAPIRGPAYEIMLETPEGKVPFDNVSQGMASIFNWLGVLVQRLYDVYPDVQRPEHESAVALIDEIDSHLHPDWQRRLVELTRRHFPRVQVIASSHSPLLAGGLRGTELCVLERGAEGIAPLPYELDLFGRRAQEILQSPAFGLSSDRTPEVERQIQTYFRAYEKPDKTDEDKALLLRLGPYIKALGYGEMNESEDPLDGMTDDALARLRERFGASNADTSTEAS